MLNNICIAGDQNTDLSRINSWHTSSLLQFIENKDLYIPLYHADANVDSTYHSTSVNAFSIIDHIFASKSLSMYITDYVSLSEEIDNQSDHSPVLLTTSIDIILHSNVSQVRKPRKKWKKVNSNILCSYHKELNKCLSKIVVPNDMLYCRNMSCQCDTHVNNIQLNIIMRIIIIIILYFRHLSIYTIKHNYKKYIHTIKNKNITGKNNY